MKMMQLKMKAAGAQFGPKWAWWWAMWLVPDAVKLPINVWMLSALTTLHPKGLDTTIREVMETTIGAKIEYFNVIRETDDGTVGYKETDSNHMKGDF